MSTVHQSLENLIEERHSMIREAFSGKVGEQVLIVREDVESRYEGGCMGGFDSKNVTSIIERLGILNENLGFESGNGEMDIGFICGPTLESYQNLKGSRIVLPMEQHVGRGRSSDWSLVNGSIEIPTSEIEYMEFGGVGTHSLGHWSSRHSPYSIHKRLLINIGDEQVLKYFDEKKLFKRDLSYVEAAKMLEIEDRLPEEFVQEYDKNVYDNKVWVVGKLRELSDTEDRLNGKIQRIYRGSHMEGSAIVKVDDEDDARIVSIGTRMDIESTRKEIKRKLSAAIRLGLHRNDWILENQRIPGETLNVPVYISKMCERYNVKI